MKRMIAILLVGSFQFTSLAQADSSGNQYWPHWRGPNENGVVDSGNPPLEWNESKNVKWKTAIPGLGHSTPVVWENRLFLLTAVETDTQVGEAVPGNKAPSNLYQFKVVAVDRSSGDVVWEQIAREEKPHQGMHGTASYASGSATTDGRNLYAFFGSWGIYCYDLDGKLKWEKDLGNLRVAGPFGEGSSPKLFGEKLILNWDHQDKSFIVALNKNTGEEIWRTDRNERTTWGTPFVVEENGSAQVILTGSRATRSYDTETGNLLWECKGLGSNPIPTPVYADGILYVTSGHRDPALQAIRLADAKGDITGSDAIVWSIDKDTPYVSSPLLYGDNIYFLKNRNAVLSCYNAKTGELQYGPQRLRGLRNGYASLVGIQDRVYIAGLNGATLILEQGPEYKVLAINNLDEGFSASPVIIGDELYLRGRDHLYCIAEQ